VKQHLAGTDVVVRAVGAANDGVRVRLVEERRQPESRAGLEHRGEIGPPDIGELAPDLERHHAQAPSKLVIPVGGRGGEAENDEKRDSQTQAGADTTHGRWSILSDFLEGYGQRRRAHAIL
jgi:hypothetical protein